MTQLALKSTEFTFPNQTSFYRGKVRDVYTVNDHFIAVATDRISAFDHVLPKPIPFKGQVLNLLAVYFLESCRDIVPNWFVASPHPNVSIGVKCNPIMIEMVVRGYLAGHSWREYKSGKRSICGVSMPDGMKESDRFPNPIITPATKAEEGHDEDISKEEIIRNGIIPAHHYEKLEEYSLKLFQRGQKMANERGLILVDTKYEFGFYKDEIYLIDEIHTPDSSRYYYADGYEERQQNGIPQKQLSKEFVREWLMANGFQGKEGQQMPEMPESFIDQITSRYVELFEILTGNSFERTVSSQDKSAIYNSIITYIEHN